MSDDHLGRNHYFDVIDLFQSNTFDLVDAGRAVDFVHLPNEIDIHRGQQKVDHFRVAIIVTDCRGKELFKVNEHSRYQLQREWILLTFKNFSWFCAS